MKKEKKGFINNIKQEVNDHSWLCIMCVAAIFLIITILSIPVNNGKSILSSIIKDKKEVIKDNSKDFYISSVEMKSL